MDPESGILTGHYIPLLPLMGGLPWAASAACKSPSRSQTPRPGKEIPTVLSQRAQSLQKSLIKEYTLQKQYNSNMISSMFRIFLQGGLLEALKDLGVQGHLSYSQCLGWT